MLSINQHYPQISSTFSNYLEKKLMTIPKYKYSERSSFEPYENEDCIEFAKETIPINNKKKIEMKYRKILNNDKVTLHDDGTMEVCLEDTNLTHIHILNTGYAFDVPSGQVLIGHIPNSDDKIMNPIFIDCSCTMPIVLFIHTRYTDETNNRVYIKFELFANKTDKYKVGNAQENLNKSTIKNFKLNHNTIEITAETCDNGDAIVNVNNEKTKEFALTQGTALFLALRKRYHKMIQTPAVGVVNPTK